MASASSALLEPASGFTEAALEGFLAHAGPGAIPAADRYRALRAFASLPASGARPGRYWRVDLDKLDFSALQTLPLESTAALGPLSEAALRAGVIACDLATAQSAHRDLLAQAFHRVVTLDESKFVALANAFASGGAFAYVPAGVRLDEPLIVSYQAKGAALFPYTVVVAGERAEFTVIEELDGGESAAGALVSGVTEIVCGAGARVTYAATQTLHPGARVFMTRRAEVGNGAHFAWASAELGASLSASTIEATAAQPGSETEVTALFFAAADQHVDIATQVDHRIGQTRSNTIVKGAAIERGQARYVGNIRIHAHAHGCEAALRDDALLLSTAAHIDSVPALEIAANDVKAFHGATVGAIDDEQLFYLMSRGIERSQAERLIALGFFEPAVARFPTEALRARIRTVLEAKVRTER